MTEDKAKESAGIGAPVVSGNGIVDLSIDDNKHLSGYGENKNHEYLASANIDTAGCQGCEHRRPAAYGADQAHAKNHCFHIACFNEKKGAAARINSQREKVHQHLDVWLRDHVIASYLGVDGGLFWSLGAWGALHRPAGASRTWDGEPIVRFEGGCREDGHQFIAQVAEGERLTTLGSVLAIEPDAATDRRIAAAVVAGISRANLRRLAGHLQIDLQEAGWRIDETYLSIFTKPQLIELIGELRLCGFDNYSARSAGELRRYLNDTAGGIIPQAVHDAWAWDPDETPADEAPDTDLEKDAQEDREAPADVEDGGDVEAFAFDSLWRRRRRCRDGR